MGFGEMTGVRRRLVRLALGAGMLLAPTMTTAQASAATLAVNKLCYVNKITKTTIRPAQMLVTGTGFVPGDSVTVTSGDGSVNRVLQATAAGTISATIGAPTPFLKLPSSKPSALVADDYSAAGTIQAGTFFRVTDLRVATVPARALPSRKVTWYFSGFNEGRTVYGHYTRRGLEVARAVFGRAKGVCGLLKVRQPFFPGGHQRYPSYGLQFDDSRHYSKQSSPRIVTVLKSF